MLKARAEGPKKNLEEKERRRGAKHWGFREVENPRKRRTRRDIIQSNITNFLKKKKKKKKKTPKGGDRRTEGGILG